MFKITINLVGEILRGLEALDKRRQLGLPDDIHLMAVSTSASFCVTLTCDVSETFARTWFGPNDTEQSARIHYNDVAPDDVRAVNSQMLSGPIAFNRGMKPERIQELFVASRIKSLREKVSHLEQRS